MRQGAADLEFLSPRQGGKMRRHVFGQADQFRQIGQQGAVIERRVDRAAMAPPFLAFEVVHAAARGEGESTSYRRDADVIVDVLDEDAVNDVRVADDEEAPPEEAPLDQ